MHLVPLLLLLSACAFIGDEHAKWREDPDGDGVIVGSDCDDADGAVGGPSTFYADADADGYGDLASPTSACAAPAGTVVDATDCDDANAAFHPGADETDCADSHDYNCDGSVGGADADADGYVACQDCDDADGDVNPAANEICNDLDDDCDGGVDLGVPDAPTWYQDADGDGFGDPAIAIVACAQPGLYVEDATDCEDDSSEINPGAEERCNTLDDDCDGEIDADAIDAALWYLDADGDGYGTEGAAVASCDALAGYSSLSDDCDDTDARYNPGAAESDCTDANDYNCDGSTGLIDDDGDGYAACVECDDGDSEIHPGATERCDAADNDCDGTVDEDDAVDASTWYGDADADGYGGATPTAACDRPTGTLATSTDCDDADSSIHPGGVEVCDADDTDEDCDGAADEAGAAGEASWYPDADGDGYGSTRATEACEQPAGHVTNADDCDDGDAAYNPGASEEDCTDPSDYNCDGFTGAVDLDGDGYVSCEDCNDGDADVNPDAIEVCDGVDNDCDGDADSGAVDGIDWYEDSDGDGYGSAVVATACDAPPSHVALDGDCDDTTGAVNPDATERCDAADADENCDGLADDASATGHTSWYADADADGYGAGVGTSACDAPASSVANATDCDDASSTDYPGATETVANSDDEDCDGVDSCYTDADGDNYGTTVVVDGSTLDCSTGTGAPVSTDCNDTSATINPGATELTADSIDQDCDGVDSCYRDADGDNYGTTVVVDGSTLSCVTGVGAPVSTDCNDASATINPGATELAADSIDQDCDTVDSCYTDADGDNYGTSVVVDGSTLNCTTGTGAPVSTDCDDTSAAISPADPEITADGIDQDCDTVDSCYTDADGDNYGTTVVVDGSTLDCSTGTGAPVSTDCNDTS
ncbi:MAG: putative metal-binding motif-containing protein, partial [Pseudomonadota bacterium]|nr:putative metal-binding motif-containing protein [Pseudomonadota bacterium]